MIAGTKQRAVSSKNKKGKTITRIFVLVCLLASVFLPAGSEAQQPKVARIGYLSSFDPASDSGRFEAIRLALRKLGYIEGQNIAIEHRYTGGNFDRIPELAAGLVRLKVDSSW